MTGFPRYVDVEFTARCNLACGFCFGPADDRSVADLPPSFWREVIHEISARGAIGIVVSGGEPTLYPALRELLLHAKSLGLKTVLSTHGRHRDALEAVAHVCDWIALPVDADSTSSLKEMRGDAWGLSQAAELAAALKTLSPALQIKLGTVATRINRREVVALARSLLECRAGTFDTWKIYQYTPRRKFANHRSIYEINDDRFASLEVAVHDTGITNRLNTVFSSCATRRRAYLFVYPDATVAIPNEGDSFGDLVLGNVCTDGMGVLDKASEHALAGNSSNFEATYG